MRRCAWKHAENRQSGEVPTLEDQTRLSRLPRIPRFRRPTTATLELRARLFSPRRPLSSPRKSGGTERPGTPESGTKSTKSWRVAPSGPPLGQALGGASSTHSPRATRPRRLVSQSRHASPASPPLGTTRGDEKRARRMAGRFRTLQCGVSPGSRKMPRAVVDASPAGRSSRSPRSRARTRNVSTLGGWAWLALAQRNSSGEATAPRSDHRTRHSDARHRH